MSEEDLEEEEEEEEEVMCACGFVELRSRSSHTHTHIPSQRQANRTYLRMHIYEPYGGSWGKGEMDVALMDDFAISLLDVFSNFVTKAPWLGRRCTCALDKQEIAAARELIYKEIERSMYMDRSVHKL